MRAPNLPDELELLLQLDRAARRPLQGQLLDQLRHALLHGQLPPGRRLPSTRTLAGVLRISRNVVEAVYDELVVEGYIVRHQGSGTYVSTDLPTLPQTPQSDPALAPPQPTENAPLPAHPPDLLIFGAGQPDVTALPASVWRAMWRGVASQRPPLTPGPPAGEPELRAALAAYLGRARRVHCAAEHIIITSGAQQALNLIAEAALVPGDVVAFEEPGYVLARKALAQRGARILPIPVDDDGLRVDALPGGDETPRLVYVTPSHQFPLGGRLSIGRRMALLAWASAHDSLVIEDDYDSEFRFDAPPLPALAGLDRDARVLYVGTFSKVLAPALRIGYLVVPSEPLRLRIEQCIMLTGAHASWPSQRAALAFIAEGHLERHIRRMRRRYAEKRALVRDMLAPLAPHTRLRGLEAGLHAFLELREGLDPRAIAQLAYERGVFVAPLDVFYAGAPDRSGLVLGYGGYPLPELARGVHILREVIEQCATASGHP